MTEEDIRAIILSLISTAIASYIGFLARHIKSKEEKENGTEYSDRYIKSVKIQFYTSIAFSIILTFVPYQKYEFLRILLKILNVFSLVLATFSFMCLVDIIRDERSNHSAEKSTKEDKNDF